MMLGTQAVLEPRLVGDLHGSFFVPDYQRGYRWGEVEVRRLLDDLIESKEGPYYLQPIVVKARAADEWELVDGQQRLTTLYLVLRAIRQYAPMARVGYRLTYETRPGSADYLDDPQEATSLDNIDYFHMYAAFRTVQGWLEAQHDATTSAFELYRALTRRVYVIWYEAPDEPEFDSRALFTRLNVGRIPLTDAELVKAALLSRVARKAETAAQWDAVERDLWSPELWAFATGRSNDDAATRIQLLLDLLADLQSGNAPEHRARFHTFEVLRPQIVQEPQVLWDKVLDLHSLILGWYDDRSLFHKIGYLVGSGSASLLELIRRAQGSTRSGFEAELDELITGTLGLSASGLSALTYRRPTKPGRVLLLMNVETIRSNERSSERYSFDQHAQEAWSLEHIHAQHSEGLKTVEQWTAWLREHQSALDALELAPERKAELKQAIDDALPDVTKEVYEVLHKRLMEVFSSPDQSESASPEDEMDVDGISNLALLSRDDNSALNNVAFEVKRRRIIALDQRGSYIPVCTRNAFLKYYASDEDGLNLHYWGPKDRVAYLRAMTSVLAPYLLPDTPENDEPEPDDVTGEVE